MPHIGYIYKHAGRDFSNGGLSATCDYVTVYGATEPFEPVRFQMLGHPAPPVRMVPSAVAGAPPTLKPISPHTGGPLPGWFMYGGCMVAVDSFLGDYVKQLTPEYEHIKAIALHDRRE